MRWNQLTDALSRRIQRAFETKGEMEESRRYIALSTFSSGIGSNLAGGNFLTGFLLLLQADDAFMGLITMISLAGNLLQILSPFILERFRERKRLLTVGRGVIYLFNIVMIGIIPLLPFTNQLKLIAILAAILFINLLNALLGPGFAVWHIKSIPENARAGFYSMIVIFNGAAIYSVLLAAGKVADFFKSGGRELEGLLLLRAVALVFCAADIYFLLKIKEYPYPADGAPMSLKNVFIGPFKEKKYLITVIIACMWSFSANIPGPYYTVYLLKDVGMQYSYLNLVAIFSVPVFIFLTPVWSRRIQRTSWFQGLFLSMCLFLLHYIGLSFVTRESLYLYPLFAVYSFLIAPGINLAMSNIPYVNIPEKNQTNFIGFYSAMNNLAALLGVALGKEFITRTENITLSLLGTTLQNKQYILLLTAAFMMAATFTIFLLQRKKNPSL